MTDCPNGLIRDQLPEYVHGSLSATDASAVEMHLASCADCRAEVALLHSARAAFALRTPRVDVAHIVSALPSAPASQRIVRRRFPMVRSWQYAAAAALVLAVSGTALLSRPGAVPVSRVADSSGVVAGPAASSIAATAAAPTHERSEPASNEGVTFGGGLSDLSLNELQALMSQMDSVRALPSSDPASMTPVITMKEGGKSQ